MTGSSIYLGRVGQPILLSPPPIQNIDMSLERPTATTDLLSGAKVADRFGRGRRRYTLAWEHLTPDELHTIEWLALLPGPLVLDMPDRRNRLTANQSTGSGVLRTTEGMTARFQGTVSSSTTQSRSAPRSWAWATGTALGSVNRGLYCYTSTSVVDDTWHPVRAGAWYASAGWLRSSATVDMRAGFDWHDATGTYLSTSSFGSIITVSTSFALVQVAGVQAPANAAYGIPMWLNAGTTGAAVTVWHDDLMVEEVSGAGVAAGTFVVGTGVPRVSVVETPSNSLRMGYVSPSLVLQEL